METRCVADGRHHLQLFWSGALQGTASRVCFGQSAAQPHQERSACCWFQSRGMRFGSSELKYKSVISIVLT